MADLITKYMGFELKNPIIAASSGLTDNVKSIVGLEKAGVAAIVLKSIFEEQILREIDSLNVNNMYNSFAEVENMVSFYTKEHNINEYIKLIEESKKSVSIPVFASINCFSSSEWTKFAKRAENAGADAVELNMFILPSDPKFTGEDIENIYFDVVKKVKEEIKIPVALKIGTYFSGMANFIQKLSYSGIDALVLFNRFYSPDIDLNTEEITNASIFSNPPENLNNIRWISILSPIVKCDIASSTGIHDGSDIIKNILVGASAVQIASTLYKNSPKQIGLMLEQIENWMKSKKYENLSELKGKLSTKNVKYPILYERSQFMKYFSNHH
jgi:dihydroorotate dehydrogenase (fumarate)